MTGARYAHSRAYDLAFAAPIAFVYGLAVLGFVTLIGRQWNAAAGLAQWTQIIDEATALAFFGLQAALMLVRKLPLGKSDGIWPRATAVLGANANFLLLVLPRVTLEGAWLATASVLTIGGTIAAIAVLAWLGRRFSILPEARGFVWRGPYRLVRHPLYLAEMVTTLGIMLGYRQPWAAAITLIAFGFQLRRMVYEEEVLAAVFPEYGAYRNRTARLIPGLY